MLQWSKVILIFVCVVGIVLAIVYTVPEKPKESTPSYSSMIHHIDSLNRELDIIKVNRDSLLLIVDSSKVEIKTINHWYEKKFTDITNQSIADDVVFFSEYLSKANK